MCSSTVCRLLDSPFTQHSANWEFPVLEAQIFSFNLFFTKAPSLVLLYQHYVLLITQMFYVLHIYIHGEKEMLPLNLSCQDILNNHGMSYSALKRYSRSLCKNHRTWHTTSLFFAFSRLSESLLCSRAAF